MGSHLLTEIFYLIMSEFAGVPAKLLLWVTSMNDKRIMANKENVEECYHLLNNPVDYGRNSPIFWGNIGKYAS
jgi:hypothetical protein